MEAGCRRVATAGAIELAPRADLGSQSQTRWGFLQMSEQQAGTIAVALQSFGRKGFECSAGAFTAFGHLPEVLIVDQIGWLMTVVDP